MKIFFTPRRTKVDIDDVALAVWAVLERKAKELGSNIVGHTISGLAKETEYSEYYVARALRLLEELKVLRKCIWRGRGPSTFELLDLDIYSGTKPLEHERVRNLILALGRKQRELA